MWSARLSSIPVYIPTGYVYIRTIDGLDMTTVPTVTGFHIRYDMVAHQIYNLST